MVNTKQRACDSCYKKKIRCDAGETGVPCNWCQHHDLTCTFTRRKKRGPDKSKGRLTKRLEELEQRLLVATNLADDSKKKNLPVATSPGNLSTPQSSETAKIVQKRINSLGCNICRVETASQTSPGVPNSAPLGGIYFVGQKLGAVCSRNGIPHFSAQCEHWIYKRTGYWPRFHELALANADVDMCPKSDSSSSRAFLPPKRATLPEKWVLDSVLRDFCSHEFRLIFPLVDPVLFEETAKLAYFPDGEHANVEYLSAKACVFAFLSIMANQLPPDSAAQYFDGDTCIKEAQLLLTDFMEDVSLAALQAVFMLVLSATVSGQFQSASMYHSIACRIVFALGGHTAVYPSSAGRSLTPEEREDRQLRLMFWMCYSFDKDIAIRTGHPSIINDEFCDLTLPEGYEKVHYRDWQSGYADDNHVPWLLSDLRLSLIRSKAVCGLYTTASLRKSNAELLRTIRELDEDLENWRLSIPPELAPALSARNHAISVDTLTEGKNMQQVELSLEYYHLVSTIHSASSRCLVDWLSNGEDQAYGIQSSMELSIGASRSIITFLSVAAKKIVGQAFWATIFYPTSALMALFFNILRNPQHEYALRDLKLLKGAGEMIRSMPIRKITSIETKYLRKMDGFIEEFGRLAEHAILKSLETQ